ncbi:glutamate--cysteine ligase, partial [Enterobacter hormaechei]|nr:glutamate--cysteine ligase [Enterobacter hormaechei]
SIGLGYGIEQQPLKVVGQELFRDLERVAEVLDACSGTQYQSVCKELVSMFEDPSLTFSARVLDKMKSQGIVGFGLDLADQYHNKLIEEHYSILNDETFSVERESSISRQHSLEQQDNMSFEAYLKLHAGR